MTNEEKIIAEATKEEESIKGRIENEVSITKEIGGGLNWTPDYKEGFIDGLLRALELLDPKN